MSEKHIYSERVHDLVAMKLAGELEGEALQEFEEWLSADTANETYFKEQLIWWNKAEVELNLDVDAGWAKVDSKISSSSPSTPVRKLNIPRWVTAAAASVALLIGVYFLYPDGDKRSVIVAGIDQVSMILDDSSHVDLREGASLEYAEDFESDSREVWLTGEAFFKVERDEERPFIVHTENVDVTVLGTSFFVRELNGNVEVEVVSGKVNVSEHDQEAESILLEAEEAAKYTKGDQSLKQFEIEPASRYWFSKVLRFKRTPLKKVARVMSDLMGVEIKFQNENLERCKLTATFTDNTIEEMAEVIATTFNLKVEITEDSVTFEGEGCD